MAETKKLRLNTFNISKFSLFYQKNNFNKKKKKYQKVAFLRITSKLAVICVFNGQK